MSEVTQAIRNHHRELADTLKAQVNAIEEDRAGADPLAEFSLHAAETVPAPKEPRKEAEVPVPGP